MDPIAITAAAGGFETVKDIVLKICGPAADEIGATLQDNVKLFRFKNQLRLFKKTKVFLEKAKIDPKAIPLRTLLPILEFASLEEEESLIEKWAALLANAAKDPDGIASHPSFPHILAEITPKEAKLIDRLFEIGASGIWSEFRPWIMADLGVTEVQVNQYNGNLFRLGIVAITKKDINPPNIIKITPFGLLFHAACTQPKE